MDSKNKKTIPRLLELSEKINIAEGMEQEEIDKIGQEAARGYQIDEQSRKDWKARSKKWIDIAMQIAEEKTDPWSGCANVKYPILSIAMMQFNARAYPAIVPAREIVKCVVVGADVDGAKADRAKRVGSHMTWQLREEMDEWEPDMDKGMMILPAVGSFFKKSYFDVEKARNVSRAVWAQNLVINYKSPTLERAPRISEDFEIYPREVRERQLSGTWLNIDINFKNEDDEELETFIEQHTYMDLDGDGYKEPYIVIIHKDTSSVVRIVANYNEDSLFYMDVDELKSVGDERRRINEENQKTKQGNIEATLTAQMLQQQTGEVGTPPVQIKEVPMPAFKERVLRIKAKTYYTKYGFMPSPDGGIYDMGFGQLLESLSGTIDSNLNQSLDAGTLANLQGGFKTRSAKTQAGKARVKAGEWTDVETNGMPLRDALMPFNFQGPNPAMFNLLVFLVDSAKDIANVKDILTGDAPQGETATTSMIKREEGMKVYTAIYKRVYRAFKKELGLLYDLNSEYLPQEKYINVMDAEVAVKQADYAMYDNDIIPVADPTEAVQSQKLLKSEALMQFVGDPQADSYKIKRRYLEAIEIPNIDEVLPPPPDPKDPNYQPPPPSPEEVKIMAETELIQKQHEEVQSKIAVNKSVIIKNLADAEAKETGTQLDFYKQQADLIMGMKDVGELAANEGGSGGVEGKPVDTGNIPAAPA